MTETELVKWVSIIRAQKRLPFYVKEAAARFEGRELDDQTLADIKRHIDRRLEEERNPELGEIQRVVCKVSRRDDAPSMPEVELFTVEELTPQGRVANAPQ